MSEWMSGWALAAWLMLGGSTVLLFIGMPVALENCQTATPCMRQASQDGFANA